jgi:hypothetical protein
METHWVVIVLARSDGGPNQLITSHRFANEKAALEAEKFMREQANAVTRIIHD